MRLPPNYPNDRRRFPGMIWPRKPGGPALPRPPLCGHRPPNGLLWAQATDEFCWIQRYTEIQGVVTLWSRSMIKEFGELYDKELEEAFFLNPRPLTKPRIRRPWPVLKLPRREAMKLEPPLGVIDEGSEDESELGAAPGVEAVMDDSDGEREEDVEEEEREDKGKGKQRFFFLPPGEAYLIFSCHGECPSNACWHSHVDKVNINPKSRKWRFRVRPPPNFHSMTKKQLKKYRKADLSDIDSEESGEGGGDDHSGAQMAGEGPDKVTLDGPVSGDSKAAEHSSASAEVPVPGEATNTQVDVPMVSDEDIPATSTLGGADAKVDSDTQMVENDDAQATTTGGTVAPSAEQLISGQSTEVDQDVTMVDNTGTSAGDDSKATSSPATSDGPLSPRDGNSAQDRGLDETKAQEEGTVADAPPDEYPTTITRNVSMALTSENAPAVAVAAKKEADNSSGMEKTVTLPATTTSEPPPPSQSGTTTSRPPAPEHKPDPFSRVGIPSLQENIPASHFPDTLVVHDIKECTMTYKDTASRGHYRYRSSSDPITSPERGDTDTKKAPSTSKVENPDTNSYVYKRVYPTPDPLNHDGSGNGDGTEKTAHLYIKPDHKQAEGNHSVVYLSPLELPAPLSTYTSSSARRGTVKVVAKLAIQERFARRSLRKEGENYALFPKHFSEEYNGYHVLMPRMHSPVPSGAMVPKFFGYYVPVSTTGDTTWDNVRIYEKDKRGRYSWQTRSPILLMEDCGSPIDVDKLSYDQRAECFSFILRFHYAEYIHGSFFARNIVIQPGPLTLAPIARSLSTPSFRLIDFGRSMQWKSWLDAKRSLNPYSDDNWRESEKRKKEEKEKREKEEKEGGGSKTTPMTEEEKKREREKEKEERKKEEEITDLANPYWREFEGMMTKEMNEGMDELLFPKAEPV